MRIVRDGPRQVEAWPTDMKRVRDSAFRYRPLTIMQRVSARRRYLAELDRYPIALKRHRCWIVRAEVDSQLVGYAWAYSLSSDQNQVYIDDVAVRVERQGQGVGGAMIADMVSWIEESGPVRITGYPTNSRMAQIFDRHEITDGRSSQLDEQG